MGRVGSGLSGSGRVGLGSPPRSWREARLSQLVRGLEEAADLLRAAEGCRPSRRRACARNFIETKPRNVLICSPVRGDSGYD